MILIILLCLCISSLYSAKLSPSFTIDYDKNEFMKDGKPFRYVSGSLHYYRVPNELWADRISKMRAAGLNALQMYVEWNSHEPEQGKYDFSGDNDLVRFIKLAQEHDLLVLLRVGPYIDAERDMGGFPYWLLSINPQIKLRTSDQSYLVQVEKWFSVLLPKIKPLLYNNGGPIIMVQVENEYGSYGCDFSYTSYLRDLINKHLDHNVVLYTTDGNGDSFLQCGKIDNVFATVDFGDNTDVVKAFKNQHNHQQFGPNVNSEYYSGWLDHWETPHSVVDTKSFCNTLDKILSLNGSVNIYVVHGGTSFGFTAGANIDNGIFEACPTSYDYDAPLNEAGDPTPKYYQMRQVISKYLPIPKVPLPEPAPKMQLTPIQMTSTSSLFSKTIGDILNDPVYSVDPLTFEQLKHNHGFVLYSTTIKVHPSDPAVLQIPALADRAQVFVDKRYQGTLSRTRDLFQLPINAKLNSQLDILVENQGRVCYGADINELKGIINGIKLGPSDLKNWTHYKLFDNWKATVEFIQKAPVQNEIFTEPNVPRFYKGTFQLPNDTSLPLDTFLRLDGWNKGVAFLNGFNLGRYWPVAGPQITLYTPAHLFKKYPETNTLVLFELEGSPCNQGNRSTCTVQFVKNHVINGTVPYSNSEAQVHQEVLFRKPN